MKELETNLKGLEKIVQGKSDNLRVVEDGWSHHCYFWPWDTANCLDCSIETKGSEWPSDSSDLKAFSEKKKSLQDNTSDLVTSAGNFPEADSPFARNT